MDDDFPPLNEVEEFRDLLPDDWREKDTTIVRVMDVEDGDLIDSFVGEEIHLPDPGDLLNVGWLETKHGRTDSGEAGPFRVTGRFFRYFDQQNFDTNTEGVVTVVGLYVTAADQ